MAYNHVGADVGSQDSMDVYCGYGTAFKNPDEFKLDMSERVHMLGATSSPFLSWLQKVRSKTATQVMFSWIESEQFVIRDIKAKMVRSSSTGSPAGYVWALKLMSGSDWMAFAAAAKADSWDEENPLIYMTIYKASAPTTKFAVTIEAPALRLGMTARDIVTASDGGSTSLTGMLNTIVIYDNVESQTKVGGAADEVSLPHANSGLPITFGSTFTDAFNASETDVYVSVSTPNDYLKGYAQGSGLPTESRRTTRSLRNYTQIFKTPMSVSGTMQAISANGGTYTGDDLAQLRYAKALEHKIDIETAILFQGGGVEGTDWGELDSINGSTYENPITRFKGMGVGLAVNGLTAKPGCIVTKNADLDTRFIFTVSGANMGTLNDFIGAIFDDNVDNPSGRKTCFCSKKWLGVLSKLGLQGDDHGMFVFGTRIAAPGELGIVVKSITTPMGTLDFVELPRLRGKYEDYAVVADFERMEWKPLVGRATFLKSNAGRQDLDGTLDYYLTEGGFKLTNESCHAVLKLG